MCGRFVSPEDAANERYFSTIDSSWWHDFQSYDLRPSQPAPVITAKNREPVSHAMLWGLLPHWARDRKLAYKTFNARGESVAEKPSFREAFKTGRCIVPASGFYEWVGEKGSKVRLYIHDADGDTLYMAGVTATNSRIDETPLHSFSIVFTTPDSVMAKLHNRMPVILRSSGLEQWLTAPPADAERLIQP